MANLINEQRNGDFLIVQDVVSKMGGTIDKFVPKRSYYHINVFGKRILLGRTVSITRQLFTSARLAKYKEVTYKLLADNSLPTPTTVCFYHDSYDRSRAIEKLDKLTYPIILKKAGGSKSQGIFPGVDSAKKAAKILKQKLPDYKSMIAQEMVFGKEYRVLVLDEKIIGVLEMIPPFVTGDGVSTIRKMIKEKQRTTEEKTKFDKKLARTLKSQDVSLWSVLPKGKTIYIKRHSCLAEGGETRDVTDTVHQDVKKICVTASKVVEKYLVGIDIICKDISKKPTKDNFNILEINSKPDLYIHYNPTHGQTQNVLKDIINFLVKIAAPVSSHSK